MALRTHVEHGRGAVLLEGLSVQLPRWCAGAVLASD